jgi:hypothetical protein
MDIPHSGNACSGLCRAPCHHPGCWQCEAEDDRLLKAAVAKSMRNMEAIQSKEANSYASMQTAVITRPALQGLCDLAGVELNWNGGDPVIFDKGGTVGRRINKGAPKVVVMKDDGASDEDVEAAKAILGYNPEEEKKDSGIVIGKNMDLTTATLDERPVLKLFGDYVEQMIQNQIIQASLISVATAKKRMGVEDGK